MALTFTITCDRCERVANGGYTVEVNQVIVASGGDLLNTNDFKHRRDYSICQPCYVDLVDLLKGVAISPAASVHEAR